MQSTPTNICQELEIIENKVVAYLEKNQIDGGLVILDQPPTSKKSLKKEQVNQLKLWFFTWNNYPSNAIETLESTFKKICTKYIFQKEVGENGTPHIQGTIELKKAGRYSEFCLPKEIHWEKTRNAKKAFEYCSKDETRVGTEIFSSGCVLPPAQLRIITVLKKWQEQVLELVKPEIPDDRTVHWIYDESGCMGKTVFSKYLYATQNAIVATGGGAKDIACLLACLKKEGRDLNRKTTFIFNFPRSTEGISWKAVELVKDGMMTSSKYESSTMYFNNPHVICFSNELPDMSKLSKDRWRIWTIKDEILYPMLHIDIGNENQFIRQDILLYTEPAALVEPPALPTGGVQQDTDQNIYKLLDLQEERFHYRCLNEELKYL